MDFPRTRLIHIDKTATKTSTTPSFLHGLEKKEKESEKRETRKKKIERDREHMKKKQEGKKK